MADDIAWVLIWLWYANSTHEEPSKGSEPGDLFSFMYLDDHGVYSRSRCSLFRTHQQTYSPHAVAASSTQGWSWSGTGLGRWSLLGGKDRECALRSNSTEGCDQKDGESIHARKCARELLTRLGKEPRQVDSLLELKDNYDPGSLDSKMGSSAAVY